jgi:hypothetical protein
LRAISDDVPTAVFSRAPTRAIRTSPGHSMEVSKAHRTTPK